MVNGARWLGAVAWMALLALAASCTSAPIKPSELPVPASKPAGTAPAPAGSPAPVPTAPAGTAAAAIDVCAEVPAELVRGILGVGKVDRIVEPAPTASVEAPPGAPPMPTAYRCAYRAGTAHFHLSVLPDSGAATPQAAVDAVLGTPTTGVPGVGEAAAVDRSGRLGNGFAFLAAAERTDAGVGAVLVQAPAATTDDKLVALAQRLLAIL